MARCPACSAAELDPGGACPSCGQSFPPLAKADGGAAPAAGTLLTLSAAATPGAALGASGTPGEPAPFVPGQVLGGRYQVVRLLGRGGMGEVWQALDLKLRVEVALKRLRPEWVGHPQMLERLRGEARAARDVVSPNVCRIFDLVELDGHELVSMEFVDGTTLTRLIRERGPLEPRAALEIASQFLAGLEAIHQAGFVHRDIKPDNLMITRSERVVLMDFGLARPQADERTLTLAGTPAYMAPEQLHGGKLDGRADLFSAGIVLAEMVGSTGTPEAREAILRGAREEPPRLPDSPWRPVLLRAVAERREVRWASARELMRALEQVALRVEGAEALRPYPGLASFTEAEAEYFFGRELEVEALWHKLGQAHLLAVIGPSGAGKSSFLRAGLLPARPAGWGAVCCTPGTRPFAALAHALADAFRDDAGAPETVHELLRVEEPGVALALLRRWRERHGEALLIVDQFEELFTLNDEEVQRRFAELLGRAAVEADVHVLISLRDDFLVRCHEHPALVPAFADLTVLRPPTGAALRRAIVQPALQCGYRFEDEDLPAEMIDAVSRERGALPLLAFAAARLWDERDRAAGLLTRAAYARVGGVGGALAQHAEATVERIGTERLPIVRELLRNLVTAQGTRAVRDYDELLSVFGDRRNEAEQVLHGLIDARLLVEYEERTGKRDEEQRRRRVEIIHESLLAAWPRLVRWQTQDAEGAVLRDQLRQAAATWEEHSRASDLLWTGTAYQEFSVWQERYPGGLTATEQAFAEAMKAETQRRRRRRRIAVTTLISTLLIVVAVVTALWRQSVSAERARAEEARRATASQLLALAQVETERHPTAALAYARKSLELFDTTETRHFILDLLWRGPVERILPPGALADGATLDGFLIDPSSRWLASWDPARDCVYLVPNDGGPPRILPAPPEKNLSLLAFGPRGDLLVTGAGPASSLRVLSLPELREVRSLELEGVGSNAWPFGDELITATRVASDDGRQLVRAWTLPEGGSRLVAQIDTSGLTEWTLDPAGQRVAFLRDRSLLLRSSDGSSRVPERLLGHLSDDLWAKGCLRFWPDGNGLLTLERSGEIRLWPLAEGGPTRVFRSPHGSSLLSVDSGPSQVARASSGGTWVWDLHDPPDAEPLTLRELDTTATHSDGGFDPGGRWLVVFNGKKLSFWPTTSPWRRSLPLGSNGQSIWALEFTPDGKWLAGCPIGEPVRVWPMDARDGSFRDLLPAVSCWGMAMHPAGTHVLVGSWIDQQRGTRDGRVFVYPIAGGPPRLLRTGWEDASGTFGVSFDPLGRRAIAVPADTGIPGNRKSSMLREWDLESGDERTFPITQDQPMLNLARFAPDGSVICTEPRGIVRLVLPDTPDGTLSSEVLFPADSKKVNFALSRDGRQLLVMSTSRAEYDFDELSVVNLSTRATRQITTHGTRLFHAVFDPTGRYIVTAGHDGIVRVGPVTGEEPHLLLGHTGLVGTLAVSPDGRWIASAGDQLFLWPMPDMTKPPLHTLPHDELVAKLETLTNLRVVPDASASSGWKLDIGPFPGWKDVPSW